MTNSMRRYLLASYVASTTCRSNDETTAVRDLLNTKSNAFRLAIDAALTVLRVDQIIMSKPAGGGKMKDARMGQV